MNNFEQQTTQYRVLDVVNKLRISHLDKINLINIINVYSWLSSNDILIDASFKDVIELFLDENGVYLFDDTIALLESLE